MNYNPRVANQVPDHLHNEIFPWVTAARVPFESGLDQEFITACAFLSMMDEFRTVIIQDAAAMLLASPKRANHGLFQLPIFRTQAFADFVSTMKSHLNASKAPYDASFATVMPAMHSRMDSMNSTQQVLVLNTSDIKTILPEIQKSLENRFDDGVKELKDDHSDLLCIL